jgi:hypothetical protein
MQLSIFVIFLPLIAANPFDNSSRTVNELYASTVDDAQNLLDFVLKNVNRACVRKKLDAPTNGHKRLDEAIGVALLVSSGLVCFSEEKFLFDIAVTKMTTDFAADDSMKNQLGCLRKKLRLLESEIDASDATSSDERDCEDFEKGDRDLVQTLDMRQQMQGLDLDDCVAFSVDGFRALVYRLALAVLAPADSEQVRRENVDDGSEQLRNFVHREAKKAFECFMTRI